MSRPSRKRPTAHREFVPFVVIHRSAERSERLGEHKQALDVPNAVVCIFEPHVVIFMPNEIKLSDR
jgi:hypothetical protein